MSNQTTRTLTARFVVKLVIDRGSAGNCCIVERWYPDYDGETDDDPVENILFDAKMSVTPDDFTLRPSRKIDDIEGAEIVIDDPEKRLRVGAILDISITVVGQAEPTS